MRKLTLNKEDFKVPSGFDECTIGQISGVLAAQQVLNYAKEVNDQYKVGRVKRSILFCLVPDLSEYAWNLLTVWQKGTVMGLIRWAFDTRVKSKPFESFEHGGIRYVLPGADYGDTTAIEWALLNIYYLSFTKSKAANKEDFFYKIIGILCRPERSDLAEFRADAKLWNGDSREVFNMQMADERAEVLKGAAFGVLVAVFQYWEYMNSELVRRNEDLFDGDDGPTMFANGEGCLSLLEDVAADGALGDLEKVYEGNVVNLFMFLRHKQKKIEFREKQLQNQNEG